MAEPMDNGDVVTAVENLTPAEAEYNAVKNAVVEGFGHQLQTLLKTNVRHLEEVCLLEHGNAVMDLKTRSREAARRQIISQHRVDNPHASFKRYKNRGVKATPTPRTPRPSVTVDPPQRSVPASSTEPTKLRRKSRSVVMPPRYRDEVTGLATTARTRTNSVSSVDKTPKQKSDSSATSTPLRSSIITTRGAANRTPSSADPKKSVSEEDRLVQAAESLSSALLSPKVPVAAGSASSAPSIDVVLAEHEQRVVARVQELKMKGLWGRQKLPKIAEPRRHKVHWDYLLEEMTWLSNDFRMERKWKIAVARKLARAAVKWHEDKALAESRSLRQEMVRKRKVAGRIAREVTKFWKQLLQVVDYKQKLQLDVMKKEALEKHLDFVVGQTERYTRDLSSGLGVSKVPQLQSGELSSTGQHEQQQQQPLVTEVKDVSASSSQQSKDRATGAKLTPSGALASKTVTGAPTGARTVQQAVDTPSELQHKQPDASVAEVAKQVEPSASTADVPMTDTASEAAKDTDTTAKTEETTQEADPAAEEAAKNREHIARETGEDEEEFVLEDAEEEDDDEGTMKMDDEPDNPDEEIAALADEGEMSIADLLKAYPGYSQEILAEETDLGEVNEDDDDDEEDEEEGAPKRGGRKKKKPTTRAKRITKRRRVDKKLKAVKEEEEEEEDDDEDENAGEELDDDEDTGTAQLLLLGRGRPMSPTSMTNASTEAEKIQPKDPVAVSPDVNTKPPFLLKHTLRPYQHVGLDWLANLYDRHLNGILADEMGLGKTIQTISLLAHLAVEKGNWGPHLIIVPTSVMLNWEMECKKWCPAFKVLTYYGTIAQRKEKRKGWTKENSFHVCITSYQLAVQDHQVFRRKKWQYMILDEAHHIKNFESKRWQTLLGFKSRRRLLLTGTPLQNSLMELWSLMHFLMPHIFQSHQQFKEWFGSPVTEMVQGLRQNSTDQEQKDAERVQRLHKLLRPFLLRRLKKDVEKQMPQKHEHVISCQLSKRQRSLYNEFMSQSTTRDSLKTGNYLQIVNVLMQLRKVCNHPNLFVEPPVVSPLTLNVHPIKYAIPSLVNRGLEEIKIVNDNFFASDSSVNLVAMNMCLLHNEFVEHIGALSSAREIQTALIEQLPLPVGAVQLQPPHTPHPSGRFAPEEFAIVSAVQRQQYDRQRNLLGSHAAINKRRSEATSIYGCRLRTILTLPELRLRPLAGFDCQEELVVSSYDRERCMSKILKDFALHVPPCVAPAIDGFVTGKCSAHTRALATALSQPLKPNPGMGWKGATDLSIRRNLVRDGSQNSLQFPDRRLIQYDCGKLQTLERVLRDRKAGGHRCLIFTQMTKMLNILEQFLTYHGFTYLRLDGATKIDERQHLMDRFNGDPRIFCFILSTRSGGLGINLTGADTVVFYDSDWNPTMDAQAQDRCHRIGQTRDVHIYRLVTERTIEENILKKANQKRKLGEIAIEGGGFTTDFFEEELGLKDLFAGEEVADVIPKAKADSKGVKKKEVEEAMLAAEDESDRAAVDHIQQELRDDEMEFDESQPMNNADAKDARQSASDDPHQRLEAQLKQLRGVQLHGLRVLERYTTPAHEFRLEMARREIQEKDQELADMEERIRKYEEEQATEDEEHLFYDKEEAYKAYVEAGTAPPPNVVGSYAPPNPFGVEEVYVEPAHAALYRVSYMTFVPAFPDLTRRRKRRKKRSRRDGSDKRIRRDAPGDRDINGRDNKKKPRGDVKITEIPHISLFRKKEDPRLAKAAQKQNRHPKRPLKSGSASKSEKKDIDTNKDAPPWLIDEDYVLWQAVRLYLTSQGTINWYLVADVVNSTTSFTGRYRSRQQCRDRYFNVIMPREDGKQGDKSEKEEKRRGKKARTDAGHRNSKVVSTLKQYELDKKQSLIKFHMAQFSAIQKVSGARKPLRIRKGAQRDDLGAISKSFSVQLTPTQISENRLKVLQQKELDARNSRLQASQTGSSAGTQAAYQAAAAAAAATRQAYPQTPTRTAASSRPAHLATPVHQRAGAGQAASGVPVTPNTTAAAAAQQQQQQQQQKPYSHRLAVYITQHYNIDRVQQTVRAVVADPKKTEEQKTTDLTTILTQLQQQYPSGHTASGTTAAAATGGTAAATNAVATTTGGTSTTTTTTGATATSTSTTTGTTTGTPTGGAGSTQQRTT